VAQYIQKTLLTRIAEVTIYNSWSDEYRLSQIKEITDEIKTELSRNKVDLVDPTLLTLEEMEKLNFGIWNSGDTGRLVPIWLFNFLKDGFKYSGLGNESLTFNVGHEDNDHRFGYLAVIVQPKKA
jgi:hypothetical protein